MTSKFVCQGQYVRLRTDFDGGALARAVETGPDTFDIWPYGDDEYHESGLKLAPLGGAEQGPDNANFAFLFRLEGCRGREVTLRFHLLREYARAGIPSIVYANPDFPVFSEDQEHWARVDEKSLSRPRGPFGENIVTVRRRFTADTAWLSFQYPYTLTRLQNVCERVAASPFCTVGVAGRSSGRRPIPMLTITDPAVAPERKRRVCFLGLQHAAELGAGWGLEGMIEFLLTGDPEAGAARERFEFHFIPLVNVDALAEGRGRIHSSGKNLNREWEKEEPVPEIRTIRETFDRWRVRGRPLDALLDIHGFSTRAGRWRASVMKPGFYPGRAGEYRLFLDGLRGRLPQIGYKEDESAGLAAGAACRRYGAFSLSVDGWVYWPAGEPPPGHTGSPDLAMHYELKCRVFDLADIKSAGRLFIAALLDWSRTAMGAE